MSRSPLPPSTPSTTAEPPWLRVPRALLRTFDALVPRFEDAAPAIATALIGFIPLFVARTWIAWQAAPEASFRDLWRVHYGEAEEWCLVAFIGALILRYSPSLVRPVVRFGFHLFGTVLLLASMADLVYFAVTGGRSDVELLMFIWGDVEQVLPVFLSELKLGYIVLVLGAFLTGMAPAFIRFRPRLPVLAGRMSVLLLLPVAWLEYDHRPRPQKALRILQPSLIEAMWWDGLDRLGDVDPPPPPEELEPVTVTRVREQKPFNVVLVLLESMGLQNTTLGRPELDSTPNLARLASEGWWVEHAFAVVPHTSKAIVTTLCGSWPHLTTDIEEARPGGLPQRCLPALLEDLGFRTAFFQTAHEGFESRGPLVHNLGFDTFRSRDTLRGGGFEKTNYFGIEDRAMLEPGVEWSASSDQPFFATYLTLTTHHDYVTPSYWEKKTFNGVKARQEQYLNAVRYVDDFVGKLVQAYADKGLLDNTLFIFQGDHGEAFNEHGRSMHDLVIYDEGLRIPMVLYGPGVLPGKGTIEGPRQQIDVLPTVLELLGAKASGGLLPGKSLFSEADPARTLFHSCWRSHRCLARRVGDKKFIDHYRDQPMQYFDLLADPKEKFDSIAKMPKEAASAARGEMRAWRGRVNGRYAAVRAQALAAMQKPDDSPAIATWGGKMDLLGCEVETPTVLPAEAAWLRCHWRAREEMSQAWRIDARMEGGFSAVEYDLSPVDGLLPTFKWAPGTAVEDEVRVVVPPEAKPGRARILLGWERYGNAAIALDQGGGGPDGERVEVGTVEVLPPIHPYEEDKDGGFDDPPSEDPDP